MTGKEMIRMPFKQIKKMIHIIAEGNADHSFLYPFWLFHIDPIKPISPLRESSTFHFWDFITYQPFYDTIFRQFFSISFMPIQWIKLLWMDERKDLLVMLKLVCSWPR